MGYLLQAMRKYEEARPFYTRALAIKEEQLGPDHPDVAASLNNMGELLESMGKYEEAVPYYERALAIFKAKLGADHPNSEVVQNNLMMLKMQIDLGGISA